MSVCISPSQSYLWYLHIIYAPFIKIERKLLVEVVDPFVTKLVRICYSNIRKHVHLRYFVCNSIFLNGVELTLINGMCFVLIKNYSLLQNAPGQAKQKCQQNGGYRQKRHTNNIFVILMSIIIKIIFCYSLSFSLPSFVVVEIPLWWFY